MTQASSQLQSQASRVVGEAVDRHRRLLALARQFGTGQQQWQQRAAQAMQEAESAAAENRERQVAEIRARAAESEQAIARALDGQVQRLAPGSMAMPWSDPGWRGLKPDGRPRPVGWIRAGSIALERTRASVPALVPLLNSAGWYIGGDTPVIDGLIQSVLLRLLGAVPLRQFEIITFDPALELQMGAFAPIREASPETLRPAFTHADDFRTALDEAVRSMARTTEDLSAQSVTNVEEHWAALGSLEPKYRLVVVNAYPRGITRAINDLLLQIAQTNGTRGVTLLVRRSGRPKTDGDIDHRALAQHLTAMEVTPSVVSVASLPNAPVANDGAPPRSVVDSVVGALVEAGANANAPVVPFAELVSGIESPWADAEPQGLTAIIGRAQRRPLRVRLLSEDPAIPHALVGGSTGQGKSNLLFAIIHALAVRYRPDQLRMYLLDFKEGVEFSVLGPSARDETWLPHAEVLALESDREFGLAVLEHLVAQFAVRSEALRQAGAKSIVDLMEGGGTDMPRILLIIDEFQVLMDGDDEVARRAVELLQQLAQKGRSYGIHLLLASQTTSGIRGLATKGDAIFSQFANRISLKNTPTESTAILGQGNRAAAALAYRGQVVVNENFGDPESNQIGMVALTDDDHLRDLRRRLWERSHGSPPLVMYGRGPAAWGPVDIERLRSEGEEGVYRLWVARPVSLDAAPITVTFRREADQTVVVAGSGEVEGSGVMSAMMVSLALQSAAATRWIVLDGSAGGSAAREDEAPPWLRAAMSLARERGHDVRHLPSGEVAPFLVGEVPQLLTGRTAADADVFVFLIAPQRFPDLDAMVLDGLGMAASPRDMLQRLIGQGGPVGVFTIGWWLSLRTATAQLGYQTGVGAHVVFGLGRDEFLGLLDPRQPLPQGSPRVIIKDPRAATEVRFGIPFQPLTPESSMLFGEGS